MPSVERELPDPPTYQILLVDDSDVDRAIYRRFLQQRTFPGSICQPASCQVIEVANGEDALAYCQQQMPDVILLDYGLPDMSGLEVLQHLQHQQQQEKLPVIVMTGQSRTEIAVAVLKGGALDYLDKSQIEAEGLHRAITSVIQHMQLTQALHKQQQRQQILTRTALQIRQALTLDGILQTTVDEVQHILHCDRVAIYRFHPDWSGQIAVEAVSDPAFSILGRMVADACFPPEWIAPYRQGRSRAIDNIHTADLSQCHVEFLESLQVQANLIVPILPGNHLWGLLVAHECHAPRHWQGDEVDLLMQLATQVSIAVQQATLVNQLQIQLKERLDAELALRDSEEKLRFLIQYAPASIAMFDREMRYIMASQRWVDDYHLKSIVSLIGRSHYEIFPEIPDRWKRIHQWCLAGGVETCDEDLFVRADGSQQWLRWEVRPWFGDAGDIGGIIVCSEDITQRKQNETRLRLAQVASQSAVWDWDLMTNSLFWSPEYYQLYQLDPSIPPSFDNWRACIHPEDVDWVTQQTRLPLENGDSHLRVEFRVLRSDEVRWFAGIGQVFRNDRGEPTRMLGLTIDITHQKQTELALQHLNQELERRVAERTEELMASNDRLQLQLFEREQVEASLARLAAIVESSEDAIVSESLDGSILSWNAAAERMFGYSAEEMVGQPIAILIPPDHQDDMQSVLHRIRQGDMVDHYETVRQHKDGKRLTISITVSPIRDTTGRIVAASAIQRDITAQKQMQQALELQSVIMNNMAGGVCLVSATDWRIVYTNPKFAALFGYESHELQGCSVHVLNYDDPMHPPGQPAVDIIQQIDTCGEASYEVHTVKKDGTPFWCWAHTTLFDHPDYGKVYVAVQDDISDRKQAEAALQESDRRWRSLLDNVQLVVVGLDCFGQVEYANPFFLQLTGFTWEEVCGKNWMQTFISEGHRKPMQSTFQELMAHNLHTHYQNPILTRSGDECIIAWSNTLLRDLHGATIGTISIGEDITERCQLERLKAEFIAVVSHELRTPLTSMQAALSLLAENIIDPVSEEGRDVIQIAANGVDRLVRLVNDILDLERLESGKIHLDKHLCHIDDLIPVAIEQMQEMAHRAGVRLQASSQPVQIYADGDRLLQVLLNLLSNAIKFSAPGDRVTLAVEPWDGGIIPGRSPHSGPSTAQWSDTAAHPPTPTLLFTIQDQGRGIPAEHLSSIFERFQQVDASDSRDKGGTGLGLAICRSIVQQHGGQIWVESTVGQGSTFYFTVPWEDNHNGPETRLNR